MKRNVYFLFVVILSLFFVLSCSSDSGTKKSKNSDLKIDPTSIDFEKVAVGLFEYKNIQIENIGTANVSIKSLKLETGTTFTLFQGAVSTANPVTLAPGSVHTVVIKFEPTVVQKYEDNLLVTSTNSSNAEIEDTFKVVGEGVDAGYLELDPYPNLSFPPVVTDQNTEFRSIDVKNVGNAKLTIEKIELTDNASGQFDLDEVKDNLGSLINPPYENIEIAVGEKIEVCIKFAPTTDGVNKGIIEFTHDTGGSSTKTPMNLFGNGVSPLSVIPKVALFRNYKRRNLTFSVNPRPNTLSDRTFGVKLTNGSANNITAITPNITGAGASHFSIQNLPSQITGKSTQYFTVVYNPTDVGIHEATLTLTYDNSGKNFQTDIPLIARATGELTGNNVNSCLGVTGLPIAVNLPTSVVVQNESASSIQIQSLSDVSITTGSSDFTVKELQTITGTTITSFPYTVAGGAYFIVSVEYNAGSSIHSVNGMLEIEYNSGGSVASASPLKLPLLGYTGSVFKYEIFDSFFSPPTGWSGTGDWDFGLSNSSPVGGPDRDHTPDTIPMLPENCYGTNLTGNYSSNQTFTNNYLEVKNLDFTSHQPFMLFFQWLNLGSGDFARIQASKDNGVTWDTLNPLTPSYNQGDKYSGNITNDAWDMVFLDLTDYAGESNVSIRWQLSSNGSGEECGWYIDDCVFLDIPAVFGDMLVPAHESFHVPATSDGIMLGWITFGADKFNVYFDDVDGSTLYKSNLTDPFVRTPALSKGKKYYYKIETIGASNNVESPVYTFTTSSQDFVKTGILINEINTSGNSDQRFVELYNPTNDSVDISGWILMTKDADNFNTDDPDGVMLFDDGTFLAPGQAITIGEAGSSGGYTYEITDGVLHWLSGDGSVEVNLLNAYFHSIDYFIANVEMLTLNTGIRIYTSGANWDVTESYTGDSTKGNIFRLNSVDTGDAGDWGSRANADKDPNLKNPGQ